MFCSLTTALNAAFFEVLDLHKVHRRTIKSLLILNKVWNCRNTWLKTENIPAQLNNQIPVFSASYHLLTTSTSKKTSQLGILRLTQDGIYQDILLSFSHWQWLNETRNPLTWIYTDSICKVFLRQQPQEAAHAAGWQPAGRGWAERQEQQHLWELQLGIRHR